jgi:predicted xylose isomerase-like sugar epimerase
MDFGKLAKSAGSIMKNIDLDNLKLDEILTDKFISENTTLKTVKAFIEKSGLNVSSIVDFKNLPIDKLDGFVKSISSFGSWKEMLEKAVGGKLGGLF